MEAAFALAKELSLEMREEEVVGTFGEALRQLLPGRYICLRVVAGHQRALSSLVANGPLDRSAIAGPLPIKRSALQRTGLGIDLVAGLEEPSGVRLVDGYVPVFRHSMGGFSVPLVAAGEMFGLVNVEYKSRDHCAHLDEPVVIPLVNQLSVALRNLTLLGEARYYRDYLRQIIDVANALIVVIDRQRRLAVVNSAMQRYMGAGTGAGSPVEELGCAERSISDPSLATLLADGLRGREHMNAETYVVRSGGEVAHAVFNTAILHSVDGTIDGVIGVGQDRDQLRLLERQVLKASKLATLGQLAAGVVHELNNPLTSISVYANYLMKLLARTTPTEAEKANKIVDAAQRIERLTRDLQSYARAQGEFELLSFNQIVEEGMRLCGHVIDRVEATVEVELAGGMPLVRGIRDQLHQVLINLVTNACHALPAPGQKICVRTECTPTTVGLEVSDTGVGIDEKTIDHIFEPFFTTKLAAKGTGLGLSIVKNIVEGHHGQIRCESHVGEGTRFHISLPRAPGPR